MAKRVHSKLGTEIQAAVEDDARFEKHHPDRHYLCVYRTRAGGSVFAIERCTTKHITLWLPATQVVKATAERMGIQVPVVSHAFPDTSDPSRYGRHSNLKSVPELSHAALFPIKASTVVEAMNLLGSLP
ncbi:hypothetical protein [Ancylobacter sp. IITR112]|uniref:hypothetical protein n=1 Tax=Ancylobacter sp. IITR112 TaxID=3138073 RepID=UPI00352B06DA